MIVAADDFLAWFVGPDDEDSCDGCSDAVQNNPYSCQEVPEPGDFECGSRCRHMVQMEEGAPDDFGMMEWRGLLGFGLGDFDLGDSTSVFGEELDSLVTQDNLTKADVQKFLDDSGLTMADLAQELDPDDYETLKDAYDDDDAASGASLSDALASADIDAASDILKDPDQIEDAIEMGKNGIADDVTAYALADALTDATGNSYTPKLKNGLWYVTTGDLTEVGTAASGNWGHAGRPGQVGGSASDSSFVGVPAAPGKSKTGEDVLLAKPLIRNFVNSDAAPSISKLSFESKQYQGTLYHGTTAYAGTAISQGGFQPSLNGQFGPGVYMTDSEKVAKQYANPADPDKGRVLAVNVSGKFASMTADQYFDNNELLIKAYNDYYGIKSEFKDEYNNELLGRIIENAMLEAHGYDGLIIKYGGGKFGKEFTYVNDMHPSSTIRHIESESQSRDLYILFKAPAAMREGGPGSGNYGHAGRPGQVGGSSSGGAAVADKPKADAPGAEGYSGPIAPWDMKADAEPRYPGDDSIYSPALKDASGKYALGRRLQGTQTGKDPNNQIVMYTFIPGTATPDQLSKLEGMIKDNSDHAQLHPGEIAFNDDHGVLQKIPGNNYWIRGDKEDLEKLHDPITDAVRQEFGDKNAWTIMMSPETPAGVKVNTGEPTTHMRVVVPFAKDTPPNTVGTPSIDSATRDKIISVMAGDDRRVWQHADFNGMHIATNIDAKDQDALNAKVRALGGELEPEEQHHNLGATRFIPKDLNIEDYEVRESMTEGGPGSGYHDHPGDPGHVGGSISLAVSDPDKWYAQKVAEYNAAHPEAAAKAEQEEYEPERASRQSTDGYYTEDGRYFRYNDALMSDWVSSTGGATSLAMQMAMNELNGKDRYDNLITSFRSKDDLDKALSEVVPNPYPSFDRIKAGVKELGQEGAREFDKQHPDGMSVMRGVSNAEGDALVKQGVGSKVEFRPLVSATDDPKVAAAFSHPGLHDTTIISFQNVTSRDVFQSYDSDFRLKTRWENEVVLKGNTHPWTVTAIDRQEYAPGKYQNTVYVRPSDLSEAAKKSSSTLVIYSNMDFGRKKLIDVAKPSLREGGPGSGNFGHDGRPGQRGGSMPGDRKQAVFMIGGPASGKGATVAKNYPTMMHIDPDAVKQSEPMYSDKTGLDRDKNETPGLYGPSGPHNAEEFAKYPQSVQDAQTAWIRANTPFSDAEDFAARGLKTPGDYQGGLTHELSSYIAKNQLDDAIAKGQRSFVFDSVGSEKYKDKAAAAKSQGFDVTFHRVFAPEDKAWQGNLMRGRSVDPDVFHDAHEKARNIAPILQAEAKTQGYHWRYTDNTDTIFKPHEL